MKTIAVINQKGGCGKTTTAINLSASLARTGKRVLLVDLDPQSHCAAGLGVPEQRIELDIGDAMLAATTRPVDPTRLLWHAGKNLDLAPSRMRLAGLEASRGGLADLPDKERRLTAAIQALGGGYDFAIIDCPPSIGLLTYNALAAADLVLIPVETGFFSLQGATRQLNTVRTLARRLVKPIAVRMLPTLHEEQSSVAADVLSELHNRFRDRVVPVVIRRDTKLRETATFGQSIYDYAPQSHGAEDYTKLAHWLGKLQVIADELPPAEEHPELAPAFDRPAAPAATPAIAPAAQTTAPAEVGQTVSQQSEVKPPSRAEEVARRAQDFLRRVALGRATADRPDTASTPSAHPTNEAAPHHHEHNHPTLRLVDPRIEAVHPHPTTQRLFGARETSQGVLFVQPLAVGSSVAIAGEFNDWSAESHRMVRNPTMGVWELCLRLPAGRQRYRLVIDGVWGADPYNDHCEPNPFGEANSVVDVGRAAATVSA
jgi:chromosome partitioning protein